MTILEQINALALNGVPIRGVEATIGRKMTPDELMAYHKASTVRRLKRAKEAQDRKREREAREIAAGEAALQRMRDDATRSVGDAPASSLPLSSTERSRLSRAKGRELALIPPPRHRRVRESYKFDLLGFGLAYGRDEYEGMQPLLKHAPSPRMQKFVKALQDKILHGGLKHVRWPRGKGKSTWVKIAIIWAALYGHKFFIVVVEKVKGLAFVVVEEVWKRIYLSPRLSVDFPEFAIPMADVALAPQRMRSQTYQGRPTYMRQDIMRFNYFKLPTMAGYPNTGAIIAFRGADQALRGINIESARPDFIFIDDPQTDEDAANPATVEKIENNITGAVLGSGDTSERISAVMASTPIEPDDVSERFADPKKHPEWEAETEHFVVSWGDESLRDKYILKLAEADACPADMPEEKSRLHKVAQDFYIENRDAIERGVEMMDDSDFNPEIEVSAYQHALWMLHVMKPRKFFAEYQMQPTRSQGLYKISASLVASRVNGCGVGEVPSVCTHGALAFCDVNAIAGLCWEIGAFGPGRVLATLAYGSYPANGGPIFPAGIPASARPSYLAPALRRVAEDILKVDLIGPDGQPMKVSGICFDGGWETETVAAVVEEMKSKGLSVIWSKGFDTKHYSYRHHDMAAKTPGLAAAEECHLWETLNGKFLAFNADYWKEVSQTSYLADPLKPSSSSFFGESASRHFQFAQEVCNEELFAKDETSKYGTIYTWKKDPNKPNHRGDTHAGLLAYGAICRFYDPLISLVSPEKIVNLAKRRTRYVVKGL